MNYKGECDYGDCISEYMTYSKGDDFATCNEFKVKEGYCEECGAKLQEYQEMHPYDDTYVTETLYGCPICG